MEIILYSADWCPKCQVLKKKLVAKYVEFKVVKDENVLDEMGIDELPVLSVDGELMNMAAANNWINSLEGPVNEHYR